LFGQLGFGARISKLKLQELRINGTGAYIGGLVGSNGSAFYGWRGGIVVNCQSTGRVSGGWRVGGMVGHNVGLIIASCSATTVSGQGTTGGLAGENFRYGSVSMSYSTSVVGSSSDAPGGCNPFFGAGPGVGGLVGHNDGDINNSYSTSTVSAGCIVGGLVGINGGNISSSYSGSKLGVEGCGCGLVGQNFTCGIGMDSGEFPGSVNSSFWDIGTSEQTTSDGGTGKTTAEMQSTQTYLDAGWDFVDETANGPNDIWKIVEGQTYPLLPWQKYGGGTGKPNDPYLIYTAEHLNKLGAEPNDYDRHFKLMADIDLSGYTYDRAVIAPDVNDVEEGSYWTPFTGTFDGNNHQITHLTIEGMDFLGLFGIVFFGAEISNVNLEAAVVKGTGGAIGALVGSSGYWIRGGTVTGCSSTGIVVGGGYAVGGLMGSNNGSIAASYSMCTVNADGSVGGLVGENESRGSIVTSYSPGTVTGSYSVGGLAGENVGHISMSYSTGSVSGTSSVGGLVGRNAAYLAWGQGGEDSGDISMSYSTAIVSGEEWVGGLVGYNDYDAWGATITESYWDIDASGESNMCGNQSTACDPSYGKTTAEMKQQSTFEGWDFVEETANGTEDIWWILEGEDYPRLWWESYGN